MPKEKSTTKTTKAATKTKTATKAATKTTKAKAAKKADVAAVEAIAPETEAPETEATLAKTPSDEAALEAATNEGATAADEIVQDADASGDEANVENNAEVVAAEDSKNTEESSDETEHTALAHKLSWDLVVSRMSSDFIERTWDFLVRNAPTREVWAFLGLRENSPVKMRITKGFQRTANSLRLPVVRHRLHDELRVSPELVAKILQIWATTVPFPTSVETARKIEADDNLIDQLPELTQRFSHEGMLLSLLALQRYQVITAWSEKIASGEWNLEAPTVETEPTEAVPTEENLDLEKLLKTARAENEKLLQRLDKAEQKTREAQGALASAKDNHARESHELQARLKQEENRFVREHEKLEEDERLLDRTSRKLKSAEKQVEETDADNKKLKKQVRQQQEVSEELQKEIAALKTQIEELQNQIASGPVTLALEESQQPTTTERRVEPASYLRAPEGPLPAVMVPPSRTMSASPLDQVFQWNADGRTIRVTTREIKRGIDANNEGWVFALIQAMDALRHASPEGYRLLLERVKELDSYYYRVLTVRTTRVLVDASNVARYERNRFGKGQMRFLLLMRDELRRRNCFPIRFIADASLPHNLDTPEELTYMAKRGELELTAAGQEADEILAREARRTGAYVITNDRSFHMKTSPTFEPPRVSFQFYDKHLVMDEF